MWFDFSSFSSVCEKERKWEVKGHRGRGQEVVGVAPRRGNGRAMEWEEERRWERSA